MVWLCPQPINRALIDTLLATSSHYWDTNIYHFNSSFLFFLSCCVYSMLHGHENTRPVHKSRVNNECTNVWYFLHYYFFLLLLLLLLPLFYMKMGWGGWDHIGLLFRSAVHNWQQNQPSSIYNYNLKHGCRSLRTFFWFFFFFFFVLLLLFFCVSSSIQSTLIVLGRANNQRKVSCFMYTNDSNFPIKRFSNIFHSNVC